MLRNLLNLKFALLAPLAAILCGALLYLWEPLPLQTLRNAVFDQYQRWQPRTWQDTPLRIIDIDEASLQRYGQWPWPRIRVAELVARLQDAGAAAIGLDIIFAEPDRTSPQAMLEVWRPPPATARHIARLPEHDPLLAATLARWRVVLGYAVQRSGGNTAPPNVQARFVTLGEAPQPYVAAFSGHIPALPILAVAADGAGVLTFIPDSDGVVRRAPLLVRQGDTLLPTLVSEALRVAQGERNITLRSAPAQGVGLAEVRIGALTIPTTPQGEVWVHYTRPAPQRTIPAWKVLAGEVPAGELENRILLVGTSAQGLMDLRFGALGGVIPGVEVHAQALEQILAGEALNRPSWASALEGLTIVCGGLLVAVLALSGSALVASSTFAALLALLWGAAWRAYAGDGLLLDPVTPTLALVLTFGLSSIVRHRATERRQRWVKQAFSRYVSPNLVSHLIDHPDALQLGGERRQCSFIFTDLAGFTALMEGIDPGAAVALLNAYLDRIIAIAFKHQGTLDRIVGDAVAIMFSAPVAQPDHQRRALLCALEMQAFAAQYATELQSRGIAFGQTRMGIHSGEVIVGNFGGSTIFDYRALGDPVNTASRLESVNKHLGTRMCVSAATLDGCPDIPARPVGRLVLKGKTQALMVFEPVSEDDPAYRAAFELLRAEQPGARQAFENLAAQRPSDPLVNFHRERLRAGQNGDLIVLKEK